MIRSVPVGCFYAKNSFLEYNEYINILYNLKLFEVANHLSSWDFSCLPFLSDVNAVDIVRGVSPDAL